MTPLLRIFAYCIFSLLITTAVFSQNAPELIVQTGHSNLINSIAFSPDGKLLVSGSDDLTIKIWDVASGMELRTINVGAEVWLVSFSPDGLTVSAVTSKVKTTWEVSSGARLSSEPIDIDEPPDQNQATSANGKFSAAGGWGSNYVSLSNVSGGSLNLKGHTESVIALAFSPDSEVLASGGSDTTIRLWKVSNGVLVKVLSGHSDSVISISFSPTQPLVAIGSGLMEGADETDAIKFWSLNTGGLHKTIKGNLKEIWSLDFSPNGEFIASRDRGRKISVWQVSSGKLLATFPGRSFYSFNAHSNMMALAEYGGDEYAENEATKVELWDFRSGKHRALREVPGHNPMGFSPDGRLLLTKYYNATESGPRPKTDLGIGLKLWDIYTNKSSRTIFVGKDVTSIADVAFSANGKILAGVESDKVSLWAIATGQRLGSFDCSKPFALNQDGRFLACKLGDNGLRIWNIAKGKKIEKISAHANTIRVVAFNNNGKVLATGSVDTKLKLWDPETCTELASLIAIDKDGWAVVAPDGRFDASPGAMELMHWRVGKEIIALSQLKERYYEPALLAKVVGFSKEPLRDISAFRDLKLYPDVAYEKPAANSTQLTISLTNRGGGIGPVQVFMNGKEAIADARPIKFDPKQTQTRITVDLQGSPYKPGQQNKIRVVAWSYDDVTTKGNISSRGPELSWIAPGTAETDLPELYAIVGGISDYEGGQIDLRFASKDAEDIAKALEVGAKALFGVDKVHLTLLSTGNNKRAIAPTKENFRKAFEEVRKARPDDILLVYLAGHGITLSQNTDTYLYLTREARSNDKAVLSDAAVRMRTAITSEELTEWIKQVRAQKQVMILDTCAAGSAASKLAEKREVPGDQIRAIERLKDRTGFHILMGSAADSTSYEASQYGQGLLTYALLQGIKGAALKPDGQVDVSDLFNYAADEVPRLARNIGGIQKPEIKVPIGGASFAVGLINEASKKEIPLSAVKPLLLRPRLQNRDLGYDNLGLESAFRQLLREASYVTARGGEVSPVVYIEADDMPDAFVPSGNYTVVAGIVKVRINLILNGRPVKNFVVSARQDDQTELVRKIAEAVMTAATKP